VITPRSRNSLPRQLEFSHTASRIAFLGLCVALLLEFGTSAAVAGNSSPAESKQDKPYALIFGTVWGPDAHPVYGVKIKIRRENDKKARWEIYSDHNGEFAQRVPAGKQDYVIWADLKGQKFTNGVQLQADEVKVHVDADERVDTGLHLEATAPSK
jgi:hypothetical protein